MRYTIFGATGGTRRQLVRRALDAGHKVTAVVRNPERLPVRHDLLEVAAADVRDPEALRPLVAGADAALSALGSPTNKGAGIASTGTRAILSALQTEGVERCIAVSAAPVGTQPHDEGRFHRAVVLPLVRRAFQNIYADLAVMEEEISSSALRWTVVRPPQLTDRPATGQWQQREGSAVPGRLRVTRADLAAAMLTMVDDPDTERKVIGVAN